MRAVRLSAVDRLEIAAAPDPVPEAGEAVVRVKAAALNHRDAWIKAGQYPGVHFPCIPGSDAAGVVESVGAGVDASWIGREVIVNPSLDWGSDSRAQASSFSILGLPRAGTLAERVAVPAGQLAAKPAHLDFGEAAALPLAGLTAWRALVTRGGFRPSDRVLISGIGGGVATFALQFAAAQKGDVWVTSSSKEKISRAIEFGARAGFLYTKPGWAEQAARSSGPFDLVIDSAGGPGFNDLIDLTAPGGRLVFFGATRGNAPALALQKIFWRQLNLLGTTMGDPQDWAAMTAFVAERRIRPIVSASFALDRAAEAFALMEGGGQFGKIVVTP
ncbi:MAG: zinc-binding dehydrogenase [Opitutaceae bacterium]